jgi:hypothetical protein
MEIEVHSGLELTSLKHGLDGSTQSKQWAEWFRERDRQEGDSPGEATALGPSTPKDGDRDPSQPWILDFRWSGDRKSVSILQSHPKHEKI